MKQNGTIAMVGNMRAAAFQFCMSYVTKSANIDAYQDLSCSWGPPPRFDPVLQEQMGIATNLPKSQYYF